MKRFVSSGKILVLGIMLLIIQSCEKLAESIKINVPATLSASFNIPVIVTTDAMEKEYAVASMVADIEKAIKAQNSSMGLADIKACKISACKLTLSNGNTQTTNNFSSFESLKVRMSSSSIPFVTVAQITIPDVPVTTLDLDPITVDLKDMITSSSDFKLSLVGRTRRLTSQVMTGTISCTYELQVGL